MQELAHACRAEVRQQGCMQGQQQAGAGARGREVARAGLSPPGSHGPVSPLFHKIMILIGCNKLKNSVLSSKANPKIVNCPILNHKWIQTT